MSGNVICVLSCISTLRLTIFFVFVLLDVEEKSYQLNADNRNQYNNKIIKRQTNLSYVISFYLLISTVVS